jgi:hypothetical protein
MIALETSQRGSAEDGKCGSALTKSRATTGAAGRTPAVSQPIGFTNDCPDSYIFDLNQGVDNLSVRPRSGENLLQNPGSHIPPWLSTTHDRSENQSEVISERTLRFIHSLTRVSVCPSSSRHEFATRGVSLVRSVLAFLGQILAR